MNPMGEHFFPSGDAQFDGWQAHFASVLNANLAVYGFDAGDVAEFNDHQSEWDADFAAHGLAKAAARAARERKEASKERYIASIRHLVRRLPPDLAEALRVALGLPKSDRIRTPTPPPASAPFLSAFGEGHLRVKLRILQGSGEALRRAKPEGTMGCQVWVKVGVPPPLDLDECRYVGLATKSTFRVDFNSDEAGQPAHFMAKWLNRRGEQGPLSRTATATIPA